MLPLHPAVDISSCILPLFAGRFFYVILEFPILPVLFDPISLFFSLPSLAGTFWFISSSYVVCSNYVTCLSSCQRIFTFFLCLSIFACCRRFLICVSNLIFHPGVQFLFVFCAGGGDVFRRLISLQHRLVHLILWCRYLFIICFSICYFDSFPVLVPVRW